MASLGHKELSWNSIKNLNQLFKFYEKEDCSMHQSDVTCVMSSHSLTILVVVQKLVYTNKIETSKMCITGPLWGESTGDQ